MAHRTALGHSPHSQPSFLSKHSCFPLVSRGVLERRISGKNGVKTHSPWSHWEPLFVARCWLVFFEGSVPFWSVLCRRPHLFGASNLPKRRGRSFLLAYSLSFSFFSPSKKKLFFLVLNKKRQVLALGSWLLGLFLARSHGHIVLVAFQHLLRLPKLRGRVLKLPKRSAPYDCLCVFSPWHTQKQILSFQLPFKCGPIHFARV